MSDLDIDEAKRKLSPDAVARAIMARAEAAGVSMTEWLADEAHAVEVSAVSAEGAGERPPFFPAE